MINVRHSLYERKKSSLAGLILNIIIVIFSLLLVAELLFGMFYSGFYIKNISMLPTLTGEVRSASGEYITTGDYIFVSKSAKPDYGDIVILWDEKKQSGAGENIIKRVIAFGGDTVKIVGGELYIKYKGEDEFAFVPESFITEEYNNRRENDYFDYPDDGSEGHVVAEGCLFVMGDNRNRSDDSRNPLNGVNGDYSLDNLKGVVPEWSLSCKRFTTSWHTFFNITLPNFFGFESKI